jgi:hypothetical protein
MRESRNIQRIVLVGTTLGLSKTKQVAGQIQKHDL